MDKLQMYRAALDCAVFIRNFMFSENFYSRTLDDELQPLIDGVLSQISDMLPKPKSSEDVPA